MTASTRLLRLLWIAAVVLFIAIALFPISNLKTRAGGLALFFVIWFGLIGLCWQRRLLRFLLLGATLLSAVFLLLPTRKPPSAESLRSDYIAGLQRYDGVTYVWGGESPKGIDCSGLIRRGLIDSLFCRGIRTLNPGLIRHALSLWWHDCTAGTLGEAHDGLTAHVLDAPSINQLDHSKILPGDLAVTSSVHVMAYLGNSLWIEADPGVGRVIKVQAPARDNAWFETRLKIVRWSILQQ